MKIEDYFKTCLNLNLNLKKGESGDYKLYTAVYEKGTKFRLIPQSYQALLMGFDKSETILEEDFNYYEIFYKTERLMDNSGTEIFEHYVPYLHAQGKVLVGGLGLGFITKLMSQKENVEKITTVEISEDVIKLCGFEDNKVKIVNDDFYSFIRNNDLNEYDYVYIDTYTSGSNIYPGIVIPTRKYLLEKYPAIMFDFWQEDQLKAEYLLENINN